MKHFFSCLIFILFAIPFTSFAQAEATLTLSPENPAPYQDVVVTLTSYSFDVNVAMITWSVNGKTISSGLGKKSITLPLGDVGQEIPLRVQTVLVDGSSATQQIVISPQSVDLVYESKESYVPPFYEGRSLPAEGSTVRVTALPVLAEGGKRVPDSNISYSWYVNDQYLPSYSGIGRSSVQIALKYLSESTDIRVLARSPRGNSAEKTLSVYPHAIMPLLYPYNELLGTDFSQTFIKRLELSKDITLSLEPFYLSTRDMEGTASYNWYLDGLPVTPQEKTILSLRPKADSYGTRMLTVAVTQSKRRLQDAEAALEVIFDTRN